METKVLTPKGFKLIGDIEVGNQVCNPDGTVARVIAVHDWGQQPFYRVRLADGSAVEASAGHLWAVSVAGLRRRRKITPPVVPQGLRPEDEWNLRVMQRCTLVTTEQLAALVKRADADKAAGRRARYVQLPLTAPVNMTGAKGRWPVLPPYTLGVLMGDGHVCDHSVTFTCADPGIAELVRAELPGHLHLKRYDTVKHCPTYRIAGEPGEMAESPQNLLRRDALLNLLAHEKFVPARIKAAPVEGRFAFIRGLFDTDGYMDDRGHVELVTVSRQLAIDTQYLLRSLGFRAKITTKKTSYTHNGEKRQGRPAYRVHVRGPNQERLFALPRKAERAKQFNGFDVWPSNRVVSVEPTGMDNARCITVDHPNALYVTDDFVVTHNSFLLLGLALTEHKRSIIFRREYPQLRELIDRSHELIGKRGRWNGQASTWRLDDGRVIEFGAVQHEKDIHRYQGRPHDLLAFDELPHFTRTQYRFLMGWLRTTDPGQRCRVVGAGNPPVSAEQRWVIEEWAPWLDRQFPDPALPGELRWYATEGDKTVWLPNGRPFTRDGETVTPRSRTFIPAKLEDNPVLSATNYRAVLQSLPEPLRSQLLLGDFAAGLEDDAWQTIPTAWVEAAFARWTEQGHAGHEPTALGIDVPYGGPDQLVIARRHGAWFARLEKFPGRVIDDGPKAAARVSDVLRRWPIQIARNVAVNVDGIGYGASCFDILKADWPRTVAVIFSEGTGRRCRAGVLRFRNIRSYAYWSLREALDPERGDNLALPPDPELLADLTAVRYQPTASGILMEPKEDVKDRIGRSPDCGDAVVYCHLIHSTPTARPQGLHPGMQVPRLH